MEPCTTHHPYGIFFFHHPYGTSISHPLNTFISRRPTRSPRMRNQMSAAHLPCNVQLTRKTSHDKVSSNGSVWRIERRPIVDAINHNTTKTTTKTATLLQDYFTKLLNLRTADALHHFLGSLSTIELSVSRVI